MYTSSLLQSARLCLLSAVMTLSPCDSIPSSPRSHGSCNVRPRIFPVCICRNWVQQSHSCNPHPFPSAAWTRSLNLSLTPEEKNLSTTSPERLSLQTKTKSMGGQSHILILGQRTWIWYEAGNSPIDCRVSPGSMLSFNGPPPARQSHIKKMLNCKIFKPVQWTDVILLERWGVGWRRQFWIAREAGRWIPLPSKGICPHELWACSGIQSYGWHRSAQHSISQLQ